MHPKMMKGCYKQQIYPVTEEEYEHMQTELRREVARAAATVPLPESEASVLSNITSQWVFFNRLADEILAEAGVEVADVSD